LIEELLEDLNDLDPENMKLEEDESVEK